MLIRNQFGSKTRPFLILSSAVGASLLLATAAFALLPPLPIDQVAQIAYNAGFRGDGLVKVIAIGWAESSFIPDNFNIHNNTPPSRDRGLWEINDFYHKEVSDACAYEPACAAGQVYQISKGGTDWHEWTTYLKDRYNHELPYAQAAAAKFNVNNGNDTDIWIDGGYSGVQTGTQANPYNTVKAAIDRASATQPVTIHIVPGTYSEKINTSKHIHFVTNGSGTVHIGG